MLRFLSTLRTGLLAGARWVLQTLRTLWARFQPRSWRTWLGLVLALPVLLAGTGEGGAA